MRRARVTQAVRPAFATASVFCALSLRCGLARAGGSELPDHGAEALGRGTAFVAKADDGTAIAYNPAGLARQRGTRLYLGGNIFFHSYEFQRSGAFPDDPNDTATPWGQKPFPVVTNQGGTSFAPFAAVSTDFGSQDRLTVAAGIFGPSNVGNQTFPLGVKGAPSASRYDFVQSQGRILYPTVSGAYRITPQLDVGLSAHLVLASFDQTMVSYFGSSDCKNPEFQACDSRFHFAANATSFAATLGALYRSSPRTSWGFSLRPPITIEAKGSMAAESPRIETKQLKPGSMTLSTALPLVARLGGRYIVMDGTFEVYDLELDATFEGWGISGSSGPRIQAASLGDFTKIDARITHGYSSTFGVRGGGAYNLEAFDGIFTVRAGAYFDSSATSAAYTRLDADTLSKLGSTIGFGFRRGSIALDVAYGAIASIPRTVAQGKGNIRPMNLSQAGRPLDNQTRLLPAVNEGAHRGFTHVVSIGMTVKFDDFFKPPRPVHFGNSYEVNYAGAEGPATEVARAREPAKPPAAPSAPTPHTGPAKPAPEPAKPRKPAEVKHEWWEEAP